MRDARIAAGALTLAATVVLAAAYLTLTTPHPAPVVLTDDVTFPDYSAGQPGMNASKEVIFHVTIMTTQPWEQGQAQHPQVVLTAEPGREVAEVNVTTFFLDLARASVRGFLVGDFVLMGAEAPDRWVPSESQLYLWPNSDVAGSDLYLTFQISLMVQYVDGTGYGYGGWNPETRLPITIASSPVPGTLLILVVGGLPAALLVATGAASKAREARAVRGQEH